MSVLEVGGGVSLSGCMLKRVGGFKTVILTFRMVTPLSKAWCWGRAIQKLKVGIDNQLNVGPRSPPHSIIILHTRCCRQAEVVHSRTNGSLAERLEVLPSQVQRSTFSSLKVKCKSFHSKFSSEDFFSYMYTITFFKSFCSFFF